MLGDTTYITNTILGMINIKFRVVATSGRKKGFPGNGKEPACQHRKHEMQVRSLEEDSLEEGMATRSSILAWRIPWTVELGGPMGLESETTEVT